MAPITRALVILAAFVAGAAALAPLHAGNPADRTARSGMYIVVFNETASEAARGKHMAGVAAVEHAFEIGAFRGYSAALSETALMAARSDEAVAYVHQSFMYKADEFKLAAEPSAPSCSRQADAIWGLDRITEEEIPVTGLDTNYFYTGSAGSGVDAYIIDTGIRTTHHEFDTGRAHWGTNTVDNVNADCHGHGTHVAGTVAGNTFGVAKQAHVYAVKVLDCEGYGSDAAVVKGIEWAVNNHKEHGRPGVINMSLGGTFSQAINDAVTAAVVAGMASAVSAGNSNADACEQSPASTPAAITVGSTELVEPNLDRRSSFSNFGSCVTIFGPGTGILSAWNTTDTAVKMISGTSMASPHVAGGAALFMGQNPTARPEEVLQAMRMKATDGEINLVCENAQGATCPDTINALLYTKWLCDQ